MTEELTHHPIYVELMKVPRLPVTLGELLGVALKEARLVQRSKGYELDMSQWQLPGMGLDHGVCSVCLAGSVIRRHLSPTQTVDTSDIPTHLRSGMVALDQLRQGDLLTAWDAIQVKVPTREVKLLDEVLTKRFYEAFGGDSCDWGEMDGIADNPKWWVIMHWLKRELLAEGW